MDATQNNQEQRELIAFRVGEQEYCVDITSVREIRGWTPATTLPHAPSFVRGVINLRGSVLPIIDLASRLGLPTPEPTSRHVIIIAQTGEQIAGFLVDAVSDILTIEEDQMQDTPDVASELAKAFVKGVIALEGKMIRFIDLEQVMPQLDSEAA